MSLLVPFGASNGPACLSDLQPTKGTAIFAGLVCAENVDAANDRAAMNRAGLKGGLMTCSLRVQTYLRRRLAVVRVIAFSAGLHLAGFCGDRVFIAARRRSLSG